MSTLLEKSIRVNRIIATSVVVARAIEDPFRAKVLEVLYHKSLNIEQISKKLEKAGHKKALTTIRHHVDILKNSGLIEIVRIDEARGAVVKFYGTSIKLLDYKLPANFERAYSSQIKSAQNSLQDMLEALTTPKDHGGKIAPTNTGISSAGPKKMPEGDNAKKHLNKNHKNEDDTGYLQYLMLEIMNRAITNMFEGSATTKSSKKGKRRNK